LSREYKGEKVVIYPSYIDSRKSRSEGRKIPVRDAVPNPSIDEIVKACQRLGLNPSIEEKTYPRLHRSRGRIIVDKKMRKTDILRSVAREIRKTRGLLE